MLTVGDAGIGIGRSVTFGGCGDLVLKLELGGSAVEGEGVASLF